MYPGAAEIVVEEGPIALIIVERAKPIFSRSGTVDLQRGVNEYTVEFPTTLPSNNYNIFLTVANYADDKDLAPFIQARPVGIKSQNYFQVQLHMAPPTGNYELEWSIAEKYNP